MQKITKHGLLAILLITCLFICNKVYATEIEEITKNEIPIETQDDRLQLESSILSDKRLMTASSYDLRNDITVRVKNQKTTKACWTFSLLSVLESNLAITKKQYYDFSERHMEYSTSKTFADGINPLGYNREVNDGANPIVGLSYMTRGSGPVLENEMPFSENTSKINLSEIAGKKATKKIEEYVTFKKILKVKKSNGTIEYKSGSVNSAFSYTQKEVTLNRNKMKEHIMKYGGLTTMVVAGSTYDQYYNYNLTEPAYYCDNPSVELNHQVTIIGWDDNYPVTNFNAEHRPNNPGAYLVLNSYGTGGKFKDGCFYISYEDCNVENEAVGITKVGDVDYDNIYQYDPLGPSTSIRRGYDATLYGANVFKRSSNEKEQITEISVASLDDEQCEIYINPEDGELSSEKLKKVSSMVSIKPGYTTIKLDKPIEISGDKFAVAIKYTSDSTVHIAVESPKELKYWANATSNAGESYYGTSLDRWTDLNTTKELKNVNFCIKAFTTKISNDIIDDNTKDNIEIITKDYKYDGKKGTVSNIHTKTTVAEFLNKFYAGNTSIINLMKIYDMSNNEVKSTDYIKTGMKMGMNGQDGQTIKLSVMGDISGDGQVDIHDLGMLKRYLIGKLNLEETSLLSADIDESGEIDSVDMIYIILNIIEEISL